MGIRGTFKRVARSTMERDRTGADPRARAPRRSTGRGAGTDRRARRRTTSSRMPDGVQIAINVRLPDGYQAGQKYPTLFEMSGYDGGSADGGTLLNDFGLQRRPGAAERATAASSPNASTSEYVTIHASVRGTGCSGGEFDLFSSQERRGRQVHHRPVHPAAAVVERRRRDHRPLVRRHHRLPDRGDPAHAPPRRDAVRAHRRHVPRHHLPRWRRELRLPARVDRCAPARVRPARRRSRPGSSARRRPTTSRTVACAAATTSSTKRRAVLDDPLIQGLNDTDNEWFRARSLITNVDQINVPIHITGAYQDEQTGPRGPTHLWEQVRGVPKRLVLTNGDHNTQNPAYAGPGGVGRPQGVDRPLHGRARRTRGSAPWPRTRRR